MKTSANITVVLVAVACAVALGLSAYPGVLNDVMLVGMLAAVFVVPVAGLVAAVVLVVAMRRGALGRLRVPRRQVILAAFMICGTPVLLALHIPRRVAFAASRSAFDAFVADVTDTAPGSAHAGSASAASREPGTRDTSKSTGNGPAAGQPAKGRRWLGVYRIIDHAVDPRGGVFLVVHQGPDGIGPDRMSYGFAYRPNKAGTPFGAAHYRLLRLGDDWYWFRVSDDW